MNHIEVHPKVYQLTPFDDEPTDCEYCFSGVVRIMIAAIRQAVIDEPEWFDSDEYARLYRFMTGMELTADALYRVKCNYGIVKEMDKEQDNE